MAIVQSGASSTLWIIDPVSGAGRMSLYDVAGNPMGDANSLSNLLNAMNAAVTMTLGGQASVGFDVAGTVGSLTLSFEATMNNISWFAIQATPVTGGSSVSTTAANGSWVAGCGGYLAVRARVSAYTSGSMSVSLIISASQSSVSNLTVTGTIATTQSGVWTNTVTQPTAANLNATVIGTVTSNIGTTGGLALDATLTGGTGKTQLFDGTNVIGTSVHPVRVDPTGTTTQPISGTVSGSGSFTVVQATAASLNATVTGTVASTQSGIWTVQPGNTANTTPWLSTISQGGNAATVSASNALKVDGSSVTQPVSGTGSFTVAQATAGNLNATVVGTITANAGTGNFTNASIGATGAAPPTSGTLATGSVTTAAPTYVTGQASALSLTIGGALRTDASATTQPVSGTVTANAGTGTFTIAGTVSANQSGSWTSTVTQPTAANLNATVVGTVTANAGTGNFTVVQSTAASLNATVVGTVAATQSGTWTVQPGNTANTTPWLQTISQGGNTAAVTAGSALKVDSSATTQPVSGTVTANAGTGSFTVVQATASNLNATVVGSGSFTVIQPTASNLRVQTSSESATGAAAPANATYVGGSVTTAAPGYTTGQMSPLSLTTVGALRVDGSAVTQPISGTVGATQSGAWTVQPGNTANTTPWLATISQGGVSATVTVGGALKVDASATTQPINGTVTANAGTGTFTVAGTVAASQSGTWTSTVSQATAANLNATVVGSGNFTVVQPSAASLNATVVGTVSANQSGTWTVQPGNTPNTTPWLSTINQGGNSATVSAGGALKVDASATTQPISGTVTANAGSGSFTVAQPTAANLNATVVGTVAATQSGTWTSTVTQATAGSLNATVVGTTAAGSGAASGLVTIQGNASGTPVPISGTVSTTAVADVTPATQTITTQDLVSASVTGANGQIFVTGTPTAGSVATFALSSKDTVKLQSSGTWTGTLAVERSMDGGATWIASGVHQTGTGYTANNFTANFSGASNIAGLTNVRVRATAAVTGTATILAVETLNPYTIYVGNSIKLSDTTVQSIGNTIKAASTAALATDTALVVGLHPSSPLPVGTNVIGAVTQSAGPWTQTISQGGNSATVSAAGALKVDGSAVTQPISGTVTANAGTGSFTVSQATAANLNATVEITDGTNVIGTESHPLIVDFVNDSLPATQNITVQDTGSTSTAVANGQNFITGTAAAGSTASFTVSTDETVKIMVSGTWTGTVTAEISLDGGTTWVASDIHQTGSPYTTSSFTGNFIGGINVSGSTNFRVRATAVWTGTATVRIIISDQTNSVYVASPTTIRDATIQSNLGTIKSANVQSAAADPALVVALSPQSAAPKASTSTVTSVVGANTSTTLLAANSARLGAIITNASTQILFLKLGSAASTSSYSVQVPITNGSFEVPFGYTGVITGIASSANGSWLVTELTV